MAPRENLVDRLYRTLDEVPPDQMMPVIRAALADTVDATDVVLHLADYGELTLERFEPQRSGESPSGTSLSIDHSVPGACYRRQEVTLEPVEGREGWTVCAPVTVRSERLGVLEVQVPSAPVAEAEPIAAQVASALAYVVASARRYTDVFERVRRRHTLALAAELQWELLPVLGYDAPEFQLAGALEPAYDIGGDNFDYAIDGDRLTVTISDAMGHGLRASLCATLAVTAMRNCRRAGRSILDQIQVANDVLHQQFAGDMYVTTLALEIDIATGRGTAVNAGHPPAWRHGTRSVGPVELRPDLPLGMFDDTAFSAHPLELLPGDRLVLLTDGILEAGPTRDETLGMERFARLVDDHRSAPPRELVRLVNQSVLAHRGKDDLLDDATLLCLDWKGRGD